jgi:hypothetical protein
VHPSNPEACTLLGNRTLPAQISIKLQSFNIHAATSTIGASLGASSFLGKGDKLGDVGPMLANKPERGKAFARSEILILYSQACRKP